MRKLSRQSKSFTERRRRRAIVGTVAAVVGLASWIYVFSSVSYLPALAITDIDVYGTDAELVPVMSGAALSAMNGAYGGLFSRSNAFIYPEGKIARMVASSSPRVDHVQIKRTGLKNLTVSVTEKVPGAVVCADLPDLADHGVAFSDKCYLVDARGYMFRPASEVEFQAGTKIYLSDLAGKDLAGKYATSTEWFKILQNIVRSVQGSGIRVHATSVKGNELEMYADNPGGSSIVVIKMNDRVSLDTQVENLIAFWTKMTADAKAKREKLEWSEIKLQFPPNVYSR